MTFLEFTFQSFWYFSGMVFLMWMVGAGLVMVAAAVRVSDDAYAQTRV